MAYKLEREARRCLNDISARSRIPTTKEDVRRIMAEQKYDVISKHAKSWQKIELDALKLMRIVDYEDISPVLRLCPKSHTIFWMFYRSVLSSAPYTGGPGRFLPFFCIDQNSEGILGVAELRSDLIVLSPRDKAIGWSRKVKFGRFRLNHIGAMATCVCVAPFGVLTGGKCIASLITANEITKLWLVRYGDVLAAITTTSLYGKSSQYNRLKQWEYLGSTAGRGQFQIRNEEFDLLKRFLHANCILARANSSSNYAGRWDVLNCVC